MVYADAHHERCLIRNMCRQWGHQVQDGGLLSPSCSFHVERHYHETYLVVRVTILIFLMHFILRSCFYAVSLINVKVTLPEHYFESI